MLVDDVVNVVSVVGMFVDVEVAVVVVLDVVRVSVVVVVFVGVEVLLFDVPLVVVRVCVVTVVVEVFVTQRRSGPRSLLQKFTAAAGAPNSSSSEPDCC